MKALWERLKRELVSSRLPWVLALFVIVLGSPAILTGFQVDDLLHRVVLLGRTDVVSLASGGPFGMFVFAEGNREENLRILNTGVVPWWSLPEIRLAFARPVTILTHVIDYRLWPNSPALMHIHSLLWYAGVVVIASFLFRRWNGDAAGSVSAGAAAFIYAVDDAHALPAEWIANRNALVAAGFGFAALLCYDQARRKSSTPAAFAAPLFLALAIGGGEAAVAAGGYLVAYALFMDRGPLAKRLAALIPCTIVGIIWAILYRMNGFGAYGSAAYIDPGRQPLQFLNALLNRVPALLAGQWGGLPPELGIALAQWALPYLTLVNLLFITVIAIILWPLRRDPVCRFYAMGMLFAVIPVSATFPSARLLLWAGLGAAGLIGRFFGALVSSDLEFVESWRRIPSRLLAGFFILTHGVMAMVTFPLTAIIFTGFGRMVDRIGNTFPDRDNWEGKTAIAVNMPTGLMLSYVSTARALQNKTAPSQYRVLGSSNYPMLVSRLDERTLRVMPERGFVPPPGTPDPAAPEIRPPAIAPVYVIGMFDQLVRDFETHPFKPGERISLTGLDINITRVNEAGRPLEADFVFERPLEDDSFLWLRWDENGFLPFSLPAVGQSVTLPAVKIRF